MCATKVGIDDFASCGGRVRGMGRYVRCLCSALGQDLEPVSPLAEFGNGMMGRFVTRYFPVWEQILLPLIIRRKSFEVFVFPYNTAPLFKPRNTKSAIVVNDTIFNQRLAYSGRLRSAAGALYRSFILRRAIRSAALIVTISETSKNDIIKSYDFPADRIYMLSPTVSTAFEEVATLPRSAAGRYILSVTGNAPSKNLDALLSAYSIYLGDGGHLNLVVVGLTATEAQQRESQYNNVTIKEHINFRSGLTDAELLRLYREARMFVFPSLAEGFGIPLIEAMAAGVPIACSNTSCMPEVAGDAALFFDPRSPSSIAVAMQRLDEEDSLCTELASKGRKQFERYSPAQYRLKARELHTRLCEVVVRRVAEVTVASTCQ